MKLRNKKTGKVIDVELKTIEEPDTPQGYPEYKLYNSLAELNEEWEDAPAELKEYWHIDFDEGLMQTSDIKCDKYVFDKLKEIGNYFETKEEAEKAVEKLKAWKRLKDNNFRFCGWVVDRQKKCGKAIFKVTECTVTMNEARQFCRDLDLLFGGEE